MKRGEIYYIDRRDTIGAETRKARPAVIVSNDVLNATSEVVEVVYLTTQPKKEMPTHVTIWATGVESTALCEHIDHVSTMLVGDYCGTCTEEEMDAIDKALLCSLSLEQPATEEPKAATKRTLQEMRLTEELERAWAERDRYAKMLDFLLAVVEDDG